MFAVHPEYEAIFHDGYDMVSIQLVSPTSGENARIIYPYSQNQVSIQLVSPTSGESRRV